jgi:hypothetical protein
VRAQVEDEDAAVPEGGEEVAADVGIGGPYGHDLDVRHEAGEPVAGIPARDQARDGGAVVLPLPRRADGRAGAGAHGGWRSPAGKEGEGRGGRAEGRVLEVDQGFDHADAHGPDPGRGLEVDRAQQVLVLLLEDGEVARRRRG